VKRIFVFQVDEVTERRRIFQNEELHNLFSSPNTHYYSYQIKEDEMGGACISNWDMGIA
jgi:hypothetical protein